jgi:hypothetical protein
LVCWAAASAVGLAAFFNGAIRREAGAITRTQVMIRARAFVYHPWRCTQENLTAWCDTGYQSVYVPGDYMGLPYDWGGFVSLFEFDQAIAGGYGAGSYSSDGVLSCTTGLDCSGYVSQAWDTASKYGTSTLASISTAIQVSEVLPGDAFNSAGYHVILFGYELANGDPVFYEAINYNTQINTTGGWSHVSGFTPRRYDAIEGTTADDPQGTAGNPIVIGSFPYSDSRDTTDSLSNVLDGCGAAPSTDESGPEYIYEVTFSQPGTLTVSVSDDVGVDIDVHLYSSMNTNDCLERDDTTFTYGVDCGTYLIVADTYVSGGTSQSGPYDLAVDFTPSGQPCGTPPNDYEFEGELGDPCAYPSNENLPFCNPNLGADTCLYTSNDSFCSRPCSTAADCSELPGACCQDIGSGELYCIIASLCEEPDPDGGLADADVSDGSPSDGQTGADGSVVAPDGQPTQDGNAEIDSSTNGSGGGGSSGCSCRSLHRRPVTRGSSAPSLPPTTLLLMLLCASGLLLIRRGKRR